MARTRDVIEGLGWRLVTFFTKLSRIAMLAIELCIEVR